MKSVSDCVPEIKNTTETHLDFPMRRGKRKHITVSPSSAMTRIAKDRRFVPDLTDLQDRKVNNDSDARPRANSPANNFRFPIFICYTVDMSAHPRLSGACHVRCSGHRFPRRMRRNDVKRLTSQALAVLRALNDRDLAASAADNDPSSLGASDSDRLMPDRPCRLLDS